MCLVDEGDGMERGSEGDDMTHYGNEDIGEPETAVMKNSLLYILPNKKVLVIQNY